MTLAFAPSFLSSAGYPNFNPRDRTSLIQLSAASATVAMSTNDSLGEAVRGMIFRSTGRYYFEFTLGAAATGAPAGIGIGVAKASAILASSSGSVAIVQNVGGTKDIKAKGAAMVVNNVLTNAIITLCDATIGANPGTARSLSSGNVIGCAFDLTNNLYWFKNWTTGSNWNYNLNGNPDTGTNGVSMSAIGAAVTPCVCCIFGITGTLGTLNVGTSSFAGTKPSIFTAWGAG